MNEVSISVRGSDQRDVPAEHATLSITVSAEGPERVEVVERALHSAEFLRASLTELAAASKVLDWHSGQFLAHADRPWSAEGTRLALVHRAKVEFTAVFDDVSALSAWVTDISQLEHVQLGRVHWDLTAETRARVEQEVAAQAVRVAVARAQAYAAALGMSTVVPTSIADNGLLSPEIHGMRAMSVSGAMDEAPMAFEPEDVTITATVEARFVAT